MIHQIFFSLSKKVCTETMVMANFFKYKDKYLGTKFIFHFYKMKIMVSIEPNSDQASFEASYSMTLKY